ncbi:MAG TPA: ABC transporter substrate-binding protein [Solirubrobacteraceae bacterium]|nr:ABC transporter substrate-binding protein [Solirubrobacteraceae bacterium]
MSLITRRSLLANAARGGLALGAGGLIAACGSSSSSSSSSSSGASSSAAAAAGTPKHGGTLRAGLTGGSSSDTLDPNAPVNNTDYARVANLYEGLVWMNAAGQPYFRLAEEMTPNKDATVWTIRLRPGVTFHNGKDVTADDLIFSINRVVNPKSPGEAANILHGIDAAGMKKLDNRTISVPFTKPYSTLVESLAQNITVYVIPVGFDPKNPVGTGPFKYVSFTPGQQSVFARNENYWNAPLPYIDQLVMTDYADETSQVNALLGGQVDVVNLLSQDTIGTVTGSGKKVVISDGGGWNPFTMRVDQPPFTDVRVRQAFRLACDRQAMLNTVFGGHGTIGNDVFGIWSTEYDHAIPQRPHDPEQARALLKQAGHEGLTIELVTADIAQGVINMAQVYAQQAAAAGINVKLRQITVTEFYGPNYLKWVFAQDYWYYSPYLPQVQQATLPVSPFNECHFDNPRYNSLYSQALATLDEAKRVEIAHEMQMIDYDQGGYIIPFFPPVIDGYAPHVHGIVQSKVGSSFNDWDFQHMWIA